MTATEIAMLTLGLAVGIPIGAALSFVLRARPRPAREVRLIVSHDAVPRRQSATLSGLDGEAWAAGPARGGPAEADAQVLRPAVGIQIRPTPDELLESLAAPEVARASSRSTRAAAAPRPPEASVAIRSDGPRTGRSDAAAPRSRRAGQRSASGPEASQSTDPCEARRRQVSETTLTRDARRSEEAAASQKLRELAATIDEHQAQAEASEASIEPAAVHAKKHAAWLAFRKANAIVESADAAETTAREWLEEIDRINHATKDAAVAARKHRQAGEQLVVMLQQLTREAEAARLRAQAANEACTEAREALALCEESAARQRAAASAEGPADREATAQALLGGSPDRPPGPAPWEELETPRDADQGPRRIERILRGDHDAMRDLVAELAGGDAAEQRRWQLVLSAFVDAIVGRAIEDGDLEFPEDHPFWGRFSSAQDRDIARAMSALGYRFDGLGSFADGRVPGQRDLSLAVGHAGLEPMRIRHWPNEAEMTVLFRGTSTAAAEFFARASGDMSVAAMAGMLGRRAEPLTEVWDAWGRIRPGLTRR